MKYNYYDVETDKFKYNFYDLIIIPSGSITIECKPIVTNGTFIFGKCEIVDDNGKVIKVLNSNDYIPDFENVFSIIFDAEIKKLETELYFFYKEKIEDYYVRYYN